MNVVVGVRDRVTPADAVMSGKRAARWMSRLASAASTFAIATAMSRLFVCASVTSPLSSVLWKLFHQSGFGQSEAPGASGPVKAGGTSCGFNALGTGVEQAAATQATAANVANRTIPFINRRPAL